MIISIGSPTNPAPLIAANFAGHVIASFCLLYLCLTLRAKRYVDVTFRPFFVLFLPIFLATCEITMILFSALEAHLSLALRTFDLPSVEIVRSYDPVAPLLDTKSDQWIVLKLLLPFESVKLID